MWMQPAYVGSGTSALVMGLVILVGVVLWRHSKPNKEDEGGQRR